MEESCSLNFLNQNTALEEITIQDIDGVPYFVIPMYSVVPNCTKPAREHGKDYKCEYTAALRLHKELSDTIQELLCEREQLCRAIKRPEHPRLVQPLSVSHAPLKRIRRRAQEILKHFTCVCGKAYGSEGSLKQHIKFKHCEVDLDESF